MICDEKYKQIRDTIWVNCESEGVVFGEKMQNSMVNGLFFEKTS